MFRNKKIIVAIIAVVAVIVAAFMFLGGGPKRTAKNFMKAYVKADGKKIVKLIMPKEMQGALFANAKKKENYIAKVEKDLDGLWEGFKSSDVTYDWKIKKVENLNNLKKLKSQVKEEWDIENLSDYKELRKGSFAGAGIDIDKVKSVYAVEVEMSYKTKEDSDTVTNIMLVYKYKGKWYVDYYFFMNML